MDYWQRKRVQKPWNEESDGVLAPAKNKICWSLLIPTELWGEAPVLFAGSHGDPERERLCQVESPSHKVPSLPLHHSGVRYSNTEALSPLPYILRRQVFRLPGQKAKPWKSLQLLHIVRTQISLTKAYTYRQKKWGGTGLSNPRERERERDKNDPRSERTQSRGLVKVKPKRGHAQYHHERDVRKGTSYSPARASFFPVIGQER